MDLVSTPQLFSFTDSYVLSSGTVSIDLPNRRVLLLYYLPRQEYLLPKGRKNVGESLEAAAVRETREESGYQAHLYPHSLPTGATLLQSSKHTEPFAVQQRLTQKGVRKIIFWYLANVDSSATPLADLREVGKDFEVCWGKL